MPDITSVKLHLYDLSRGLASQDNNDEHLHEVNGVWHTGVAVGNTEWFYGHGIHSSPVERTPAGTPDHVVDLGMTEVPHDVMDAYLVALDQGKYAPARFHVIENNSNSFADDFAKFLTSQGIPDFARFPTDLVCTPRGQILLSFLVNFENVMAAHDAEPPVISGGKHNSKDERLHHHPCHRGRTGPRGPRHGMHPPGPHEGRYCTCDGPWPDRPPHGLPHGPPPGHPPGHPPGPHAGRHWAFDDPCPHDPPSGLPHGHPPRPPPMHKGNHYQQHDVFPVAPPGDEDGQTSGPVGPPHGPHGCHKGHPPCRHRGAIRGGQGGYWGCPPWERPFLPFWGPPYGGPPHHGPAHKPWLWSPEWHLNFPRMQRGGPFAWRRYMHRCGDQDGLSGCGGVDVHSGLRTRNVSGPERRIHNHVCNCGPGQHASGRHAEYTEVRGSHARDTDILGNQPTTSRNDQSCCLGNERVTSRGDDSPSLDDMLRRLLRGVATAVGDVVQAGGAALDEALAEHHAVEASLHTVASQQGDAGTTIVTSNSVAKHIDTGNVDEANVPQASANFMSEQSDDFENYKQDLDDEGYVL